MAISVRRVTGEDAAWVDQLMEERWGGDAVVSRGKVHVPSALPGFIAEVDRTRQGLITYTIAGTECEVVSLDSRLEGEGIGTRLLDEVLKVARERGCTRVWMITTNDNLHALGFYQRRGFHISAVFPGQVDESRKLKPAIPETSEDGIPIRDEIELEILLAQ